MSSSGSVKKRKALTIGEKLEIIEILRKGKKQVEVATEKGIAQSTIRQIWSQRDEIAKKYCEFNVTTKKARRSTYPEVDAALLKWFDSVRDEALPLHGPILLEKACEIAKQLNVADFSG